MGEVPLALRDTHYQGASKLGNGEGYLYPHDFPGHWAAQNYMPDGFEESRYYFPGLLGFEGGLQMKKGGGDGPER